MNHTLHWLICACACLSILISNPLPAIEPSLGAFTRSSTRTIFELQITLWLLTASDGGAVGVEMELYNASKTEPLSITRQAGNLPMVIGIYNDRNQSLSQVGVIRQKGELGDGKKPLVIPPLGREHYFVPLRELFDPLPKVGYVEKCRIEIYPLIWPPKEYYSRKPQTVEEKANGSWRSIHFPIKCMRIENVTVISDALRLDSEALYEAVKTHSHSENTGTKRPF